MNRISDLTRRLWAALLALCLVLALTLPVFAEGESETADTAEKETFHIGTVDVLLQLFGRQSVAGYAIGQHTAKTLSRFKYGGFVPHQRQVIRR